MNRYNRRQSNRAGRVFFEARRLVIRAESRRISLRDSDALEAAERSWGIDPLASRAPHGKNTLRLRIDTTWVLGVLQALDAARLP